MLGTPLPNTAGYWLSWPFCCPVLEDTGDTGYFCRLILVDTGRAQYRSTGDTVLDTGAVWDAGSILGYLVFFDVCTTVFCRGDERNEKGASIGACLPITSNGPAGPTEEEHTEFQ